MSIWKIIAYFSVFSAIMGFALGASIFAPFETTITLHQPNHKQSEQNSSPAKSSHEGPDSELADYTLWLMIFTGVLAFATIGLGIATAGLYFAGERQLIHITESSAQQSTDMQASIAVADSAAGEARRANRTTKEAVIADQRPWLRWKIDTLVTPTIADGNIFLQLNGAFTNFGRTPAMNVCCAAKLYVPSANETVEYGGERFYWRHLRQISTGFSPIANMIPGEETPFTITSEGISLESLPDQFRLCLVFHAFYFIHLGPEGYGSREADIGCVYILKYGERFESDLIQKDLIRSGLKRFRMDEIRSARKLS